MPVLEKGFYSCVRDDFLEHLEQMVECKQYLISILAVQTIF